MPLANAISQRSAATLARSVAAAPAGVAEVTTFDFAGRDEAHFATGADGKSLVLNAAGGIAMEFWFRTFSEAETEPGSPTGNDFSRVNLPDAATDEDCAEAFRARVEGVGHWTASRVGTVVTVTDDALEARDDAFDVNSDVVIAVTTQGVDP